MVALSHIPINSVWEFQFFPTCLPAFVTGRLVKFQHASSSSSFSIPILFEERIMSKEIATCRQAERRGRTQRQISHTPGHWRGLIKSKLLLWVYVPGQVQSLANGYFLQLLGPHVVHMFAYYLPGQGLELKTRVLEGPQLWKAPPWPP